MKASAQSNILFGPTDRQLIIKEKVYTKSCRRLLYLDELVWLPFANQASIFTYIDYGGQ